MSIRKYHISLISVAKLSCKIHKLTIILFNFCQHQDATCKCMRPLPTCNEMLLNGFAKFTVMDRVSRFIYFFIIILLLFILRMLLSFQSGGESHTVTILTNIYFDFSAKYDQAVSLKTHGDRFELQRFRYNLVTQ